MKMDIKKLIQEAVTKGASDLHIVAEAPPAMSVAGEIIIMDTDKLTPEDTKNMIYEILSEEQKKVFETDWKISFSTILPEVAHVRVSVYYHLGNVGAAIRIRSMEIRTLKQLGLPAIAEDFTRKPYGLILITGSTGSGKTTTLYSMIDHINQERRCRIITVEDPVEYVHQHKRSIIIQQEIGSDAKSFYEALMHILRLDPDVICVGEMRELETIKTALNAAETGHLVIATLHTGDVTQAIDRIINIFPPHERSLISTQLASCLQGIIAQSLLPTLDKKNIVLAYEILVGTDAVHNVIREEKLQMLYGVIQGSRDFGMQTMDETLRSLYHKGVITYNTAAIHARDPKYVRS